MNKRFHELDGLRGLASLIVVFSHIDLMFGRQSAIINYTPLRILVAGPQSVILFFLLSGYVLSLPYHAKREKSYGRYLVSRMCRIWIPYMAVLCLAVIGKQFLYHARPQVSEWLQGWWRYSVTPQVLFNYITMIGTFDMNLNPVLWSLVQEMRISILFPFLMLFLRRTSHRTGVLSVVLLGVTSFSLAYFFRENTFARTPHYTMFFIFGALLAKYPVQLKEKKTLGIVAALLFAYATFWVNEMAPLPLQFATDMITGLATAIFMMLAFQASPFKRFLNSHPVQFLGRISYSLYLVHLPVMVALFYAFNLSLGWVAILTAPASISIAAVLYYTVEKPAMELGRRLTKREKHTAIHTIKEHKPLSVVNE